MSKSRLLIVEDDVDIANMLEIYFGGLHYEVDIASRGSEALDKTRQRLPHLIVLDYMLPDSNGNVVCRTIRQDPAVADVVILVISGVVNPADVDRLMAAGADDFIKKPFNLEQVIQRILDLVKR